MIVLRRDQTADRINRTLNHPDVRPFVDSMATGPIDVSAVARDARNVVLTAEYGGCVFVRIMHGVYEAHMHVVPEGRGAWSSEFIDMLLHWMFTKTEAYDILTRIPQGHIAARASALGHGMRNEFSRPNAARFQGKVVDINVHSIRVQDWAAHAPWLPEMGAWFHGGLVTEAKRLGVAEPPHGPDEDHDRYVGLCVEMARGGQVRKGVTLYNRWAALSRQKTISFVSDDPPSVKIDVGVVRLVNDRVELLSSC